MKKDKHNLCIFINVMTNISIFIDGRDRDISLLTKKGIKYEGKADTSEELGKQLLLNSQGM